MEDIQIVDINEGAKWRDIYIWSWWWWRCRCFKASCWWQHPAMQKCRALVGTEIVHTLDHVQAPSTRSIPYYCSWVLQRFAERIGRYYVKVAMHFCRACARLPSAFVAFHDQILLQIRSAWPSPSYRRSCSWQSHLCLCMFGLHLDPATTQVYDIPKRCQKNILPTLSLSV